MYCLKAYSSEACNITYYSRSISKMFRYFAFIFFLLFVSVKTSTVSPINKIIRLAFGVSKATYLPFDESRYIQNSHIMGRTKNKDHIVCSVGGWVAKSYEIKDTELILFEHVEQKLAVFGFRGTEPTNIKDWQKNFQIDLEEVEMGSTKFKIHKGYNNRYQDIKQWFETEYNKVSEDYKIIITGHSLGGALTTIAAVYASGELKRRPDAVITFASPKVGEDNFQDYYDKTVGCDRTLRITVEGDVVTNFPPHDKRYTHVCNALELNGIAGWLSRWNLPDKHNLYKGFEVGLKKKFSNVDEINFGCDKKL